MEKTVNEVKTEEVIITISKSEFEGIAAEVVADIANDLGKDGLVPILLGGAIVAKIKNKIFDKEEEK